MLAVVVALQTHYGISSFNWIKPEFSMIAMAGREEEAGPYHQSACLQRPAITAKGLPPPPPHPIPPPSTATRCEGIAKAMLLLLQTNEC